MEYSITLLVLISSFFVVALAFTKPSIATDFEVAASEPVLDTDGEELRAGTEYYVLPFTDFFPSPSGLIMGRIIGDQLCPLSVLQDPGEVFRGHPLTFTPVDPEEGVIRVSTDLNIKFIDPSFPICAQYSKVWRIQKSSNPEIQWSVSTGGIEGNPGRDTVTNWFKIEKSGEDSYKLVFCPTVCDGGVLCRDIGIYINSFGQRILSLSDKLEPYNFVFVKRPLSSVV